MLHRRILMVAVAALLTCAAAPAGAEDDPARFLRSIYRLYLGPGCDGPAYAGSPAKARRYFTADLVRLMERHWKTGDAPPPGFDPLIEAQDCDIKSLPELTIVPTGPDTARGEVVLVNLGQRAVIHHDLVRTPQGWRIGDVRWPASPFAELRTTSLRALLVQP